MAGSHRTGLPDVDALIKAHGVEPGFSGVRGLRCSRNRLSLRAVMQQLDADGLPPLAPPTASDDERASAIVVRMVARHGAPSIEDYRKGYEQSGVPWPGDEEIRRRHPVAPAA